MSENKNHNDLNTSKVKTRTQRRLERERQKKQKKRETFVRIGQLFYSGGKQTAQCIKKYAKKATEHFGEANDKSAGQNHPAKPRVFSLRLTFPVFVLVTVLVLFVALLALDNQSIRVETQSISISGLPKDLEGYTILHLSDLNAKQFGNKQATLLRKIAAENYNMVVMTGDMVGRSGNAQPLYDLLEGMGAGKPIYFIAGDADPEIFIGSVRSEPGTLSQKILADWVVGAEQRGATFLNAPIPVTVGSATLWLTPEYQLTLNATEELSALEKQHAIDQEDVLEGEEIGFESLPFTEYRLNSMKQLQYAVSHMQTEDIHIALSHYPPTMEYLGTSKQLNADGNPLFTIPADLIMAGHYCGGEWKFPFVGAIYIPAPEAKRHGWFPAQSSVEGLKSLGNAWLYTSPGLADTKSIWFPPIRLFNTPTITLITLTSAPIAGPNE